MNIILIFFAIKYKGDWDKIYKALEEKERVSMKEVTSLEEEIEKKGWDLITIIDGDYPEKLKTSFKPPFVIWLKGNKELINNKMVTFTGEVLHHKEKEIINKFLPEIVKSNILINSTKTEVDEYIGLSNTKNMIWVLSRGLVKGDEEIGNDLIITEYPPKVNETIKRRKHANRISSAFASSLILVSSIKDSVDNTNLVTNFLNLGKEIYAFAGNGDENDGNSEWIKSGANLITGIKDLSN